MELRYLNYEPKVVIVKKEIKSIIPLKCFSSFFEIEEVIFKKPTLQYKDEFGQWRDVECVTVSKEDW